MRENPGLYEQNSIARQHARQSRNAWQILGIHEALSRQRTELKPLRQRVALLERQIQNLQPDDVMRAALVEEARSIKSRLRDSEEWEKTARDETEHLALQIPNLSSSLTPAGAEPQVIGWIGGDKPPTKQRGGTAISHVEIGRELDLLDFEAAATTSGWGWYFLKNEGALLEQALVQYALSVAMSRGWKVMTPPSLVYKYIASACGFMPRDRNGETQIYSVESTEKDFASRESEGARLVLAGTAEIPLAASQANRTLQAADLPLKVIGPSRSYRAEAGARGLDTRGLYRVHEFTKVEMFAWTSSGPASKERPRFGSGPAADEDALGEVQTERVFAEMLDIQREILTSLGLHARVLEMPAEDLGASAHRKIDIEAYFPSRTAISSGYGEVTSASSCTDYQSRRLATRIKHPSGGLTWPNTLNGTALAVPRVLACLLENGWDAETRTVAIPDVLAKWMPGNIRTIGPR